MTTSLSAREYPLVEDLRGNDGEDPGTLSVVAILNSSPHYPDYGRIICGSPEISESDLGGWSGCGEATTRLAETLLEAVRDADAAADSYEPPIVSARGDEGACTCCGRGIVAGSPIQIFDDGYGPDGRVRHVVVHAERCTEEMEPLSGIHYPLYFVDYRTTDGMHHRESAMPWNHAVDRAAELAQRTDVFAIEYTKKEPARHG